MRGLARILRDGASQGAGFLISPTRLNTCAHVVNLALGRVIRCPDQPDPDNTVVLDFPVVLDFQNDVSDEDGTHPPPRRIGRVVAWHPPTPEGQDPGPTDDIAVLELDRPMPNASVPALYPVDRGPDDGIEIKGWGTPPSVRKGLWADATLSDFQGPLRQVNLKYEGPRLQGGFSGGPLCAKPNDEIIGMMIAVNDSEDVAWLLPLAALRRVWDKLQVLTVHVRVERGQLYAQPHGSAEGTALARLSEKTEQDPGSALLDALFAPNARGPAGPLAGLSAAGPDPQGGNAAVTWAPPRLRIRCADVDSADLPWHIVADANANGTRLGETGWIIEVTGPTPSATVTVEIDTPLILAPGSAALAPGVLHHVTLIAAALTELLGHKGANASWAVNKLDLKDALRRKPPPDLVYCYAHLTARDQLLLGRDRSAREYLPLDELLALLHTSPSSPRLLWLHLVSDDEATQARARRLILDQRETAGIQLFVLQFTKSGSPSGHGLKTTQEALKALAKCRTPIARSPHCRSGFAEPAAALSRLGTSGTRFWLSCKGLRLSPAPDEGEWERALIRASLIPHLLGRTAEKDALAGRVGDSRYTLLLYHVCGERQACVHDFPDQGRFRLEDDLRREGMHPKLTVRQILIPGRIRPDQDAEELNLQLVEALRYIPNTETPSDALLRFRPGGRGLNADEPLVVSLAWLMEPAAGLSADEAVKWLEHWKQTLLAIFPRDEIPEHFRVLAGVCLRWRRDKHGVDWPSRAGTTAAEHQRRAADVLDSDRHSHKHCDWVRIEIPLDQLKRGELTSFFQEQLDKGRICMRGLAAKDLSDWVWASTKGLFEPTVDLIYAACKQHFAEVRREGGAASATPGVTP